jgi:hypothetical protein
LSHSALLSIGQFCDNGFEALFTQDNLQILKDKNPILSGSRHLNTGLWMLSLNNQLNTTLWTPSPRPAMASSAYDMTTKSNLVQYLHQCCFSSPKSA